MSGQKWISVKKKLPEKYDEVLVYLFGHRYCIAWINGDGEWGTDDYVISEDFGREYLPKVWMPLPEPPMIEIKAEAMRRWGKEATE